MCVKQRERGKGRQTGGVIIFGDFKVVFYERANKHGVDGANETEVELLFDISHHSCRLKTFLHIHKKMKHSQR